MPVFNDIIFGGFTEREICGNKFYDGEIICIKPTFTEPTIGEHDFNTCEDCQNTLKTLSGQIEERFKKFPNCCEQHKLLLKESWFNKDDYSDIGKLVSTKVVYTKQHILNNISKENWYEDIVHYIEYTVFSFGTFKNFEGLYLHDYYYLIHSFLASKEAELTPTKVKQLQDYLISKKSLQKNNTTDINVLLSIYDRWVKLLPLEISFLSELKTHFNKFIPILQGKPVYNPYSKDYKSVLHTKSSLIDLLLSKTNQLIVSVNTYVLNEKGLLKDVDKLKLEIVLAERKNKLAIGYTNHIANEDTQFRNILKEWFKDEKKFIDDISKYLKEKSTESIHNTSKAALMQSACENYKFSSLPKVKDNLNDKHLANFFELMTTKKAPYQIAMLHYMGFIEVLYKDNTKDKAYTILSQILTAKHRVVKGNCLVLGAKTSENKTTYTSHLHKEEVEKDYKSIKMG